MATHIPHKTHCFCVINLAHLCLYTVVADKQNIPPTALFLRMPLATVSLILQRLVNNARYLAVRTWQFPATCTFDLACQNTVCVHTRYTYSCYVTFSLVVIACICLIQPNPWVCKTGYQSNEKHAGSTLWLFERATCTLASSQGVYVTQCIKHEKNPKGFFHAGYTRASHPLD